jgi:hypothetical protein
MFINRLKELSSLFLENLWEQIIMIWADKSETIQKGTSSKVQNCCLEIIMEFNKLVLFDRLAVAHYSHLIWLKVPEKLFGLRYLGYNLGYGQSNRSSQTGHRPLIDQSLVRQTPDVTTSLALASNWWLVRTVVRCLPPACHYRCMPCRSERQHVYIIPKMQPWWHCFG